MNDQNTQEPILKFFACGHLPPRLREISQPFCDLAHALVDGYNGGANFTEALPRNAERSVALRKLLEAKDAAVRAAL
jgi:hypothetical protein